MSRVCTICNQGPKIGATRSHSNIQTKRWTNVNLQTKKIAGRRQRVCTNCIKTLNRRGK